MTIRSICLSALVALVLCGCKSAPETRDIKLRIDSEPKAADIEYRVMLMPSEGPVVPKAVPWEYIGRTPYEDVIKVPVAFLEQPLSKLQFRVKKHDYHAWIGEVPQPAIDFKLGVVLKPVLRSVYSEEE